MEGTREDSSEAERTSGAAIAVLDLPELLETILLNLDIITLFGVQRVNTTFRAVIGSSKRLKGKMFLIEDSSVDTTGHFESIVNPLLLDPATDFWKGQVNFLFFKKRQPAYVTMYVRVKDASALYDLSTKPGSWRQSSLTQISCGMDMIMAVTKVEGREIVVERMVSLLESATLKDVVGEACRAVYGEAFENDGTQKKR